MIDSFLNTDLSVEEKLPTEFVDQDTSQDKDTVAIKKILDANTDKNFVSRILTPDSCPVLKENDTTIATHKMMWGTVDGKSIVYPKVIQDPDTQELKELSADEAFKYALKNKEYIEMPDEQSADWFSKNYKKYWGSIQSKFSRYASTSKTDITTPDDLVLGGPDMEQASMESHAGHGGIDHIPQGFKHSFSDELRDMFYHNNPLGETLEEESRLNYSIQHLQEAGMPVPIQYRSYGAADIPGKRKFLSDNQLQIEALQKQYPEKTIKTLDQVDSELRDSNRNYLNDLALLEDQKGFANAAGRFLGDAANFGADPVQFIAGAASMFTGLGEIAVGAKILSFLGEGLLKKSLAVGVTEGLVAGTANEAESLLKTQKFRQHFGEPDFKPIDALVESGELGVGAGVGAAALYPLGVALAKVISKATKGKEFPPDIQEIKKQADSITSLVTEIKEPYSPDKSMNETKMVMGYNKAVQDVEAGNKIDVSEQFGEEGAPVIEESPLPADNELAVNSTAPEVEDSVQTRAINDMRESLAAEDSPYLEQTVNEEGETQSVFKSGRARMDELIEEEESLKSVMGCIDGEV